MNCEYCGTEMERKTGGDMRAFKGMIKAEFHCPKCEHIWPSFVMIDGHTQRVIGAADPCRPLGSQILEIPEE